MLAFVAMLCTGADNCSVIPKPIYLEGVRHWEDKVYLVEICKRGVTPEFREPKHFGAYTIESVLKPYELCSIHQRPRDELHNLNEQ